MLCQTCENIFRGSFHNLHDCSTYQARVDRIRALNESATSTNRHYRPHQPDVSRLYQSALQECWICTQIFEDVCRRCMEEDRFPQNSTPAEIAKLIFEATTKIDTAKSLVGNFTIYELRDSDGGDMTLCIYVENLLLPRGGYKYNLADQRESVEGQSCSPQHSISRFIDSDWPLYRVRLWLDTCIDKHSRCSMRTPGWFPTRLLDLNESTNGIIRLVETKGIGNGAIENYMTLSHCWGRADIYKLTSETERHLLGGLKIALLPRTFQRTIDVVRSLGTKYLWIDSLCIIQNSTADWEQESAQMGQVYSNGLLNIAATGSTDGEGGLLRERPSKLPLESTACYISSSWTDHSNSNLLIHHSHLPDRMLLDGPLLSRGWVLQERIMAKRILHFGKNQLYWECNEHDCCEIYPTGVPELWTRPTNCNFSKRNIPDLFIEYGSNFGVVTTANSNTINASITQTPSELTDAAAILRPSTLEGDPLASTASPTPATFQRLATEFWNASPSQARIFMEGVISRGEDRSFSNGFESQKQAIDFWNCVVSIYSRCELTFEKDKLVALAGIARAMKVQMGCDYLAGMWRTELERNLLWTVDSKFRRPKECRAPSWSWASVDGGINIPERRSKTKKDEVEIEILCVSTQKKSADEMGQVVSGALTVRGPLMSCFVQKIKDFESLPEEIAEDYDSDDYTPENGEYVFKINGAWGDGTLSMDSHEPFDTSLKTELYCLPIMKGKEPMHDDSCECLVLERTTKEPGVFKRCGTLLFFHAAHDIDADNGWIAWNAWEQCGGVILNEEWFDSGVADADGKYTITII